MASTIHNPLRMDLSSATTDLLEFLDTQTQVRPSEATLSHSQRQTLVSFADSTNSSSRESTTEALNIISQLLKNEHFSIKVVELFRPIVVDLVARWLTTDASSPRLGNSSGADLNRNAQGDLESMARAFALILPIVPQTTRYVV